MNSFFRSFQAFLQITFRIMRCMLGPRVKHRSLMSDVGKTKRTANEEESLDKLLPLIPIICDIKSG